VTCEDMLTVGLVLGCRAVQGAGAGFCERCRQYCEVLRPTGTQWPVPGDEAGWWAAQHHLAAAHGEMVPVPDYSKGSAA
jgi:hypothetical protein